MPEDNGIAFANTYVSHGSVLVHFQKAGSKVVVNINPMKNGVSNGRPISMAMDIGSLKDLAAMGTKLEELAIAIDKFLAKGEVVDG